VKPCLTCATPTPRTRCPGCRAIESRRQAAARPDADRVYNTSAWQRLRAEVLADDAYTCAYCGRPATSVDHVVPVRVRPDLALERSNVVASCASCQRRRQAPRGARSSRNHEVGATALGSLERHLSPENRR
jgi:5-methylcytosine-specific restriction endonuclease McrA